MRTLIVGDIQGCYEELVELLDRAGIGDDDRVVAVGDLVDRGPDSPAVLDFFQRRPDALAVLGNHERKHLRWSRGEIEPAPSQVITRRQLGEARYPAALAYMAGLPLYLELPEVVVFHGFWEPGIPLAEQAERVLVGTTRAEQRLQKRFGRPWYELYDGSKPAVVGHRAYNDREPFVYLDRVYGVDTGCCFGGALTGLLLPEFRFVAVPARRDHWSALRREHDDLRFATGNFDYLA